jgi:hypothetical protein
MKGAGGLARMDASFENQRKGTRDTRRCKGIGNSNITRWIGTGCDRTRTANSGLSDMRGDGMRTAKTGAMLAMCGFIGLGLPAETAWRPYTIRRGDEIMAVSNMPQFTVSEPVTNSFVYVVGVRVSLVSGE